jgi:hypothetical protein
LHGAPLTTAKLLKGLARGPRQGQSRRAWGREIIQMVRDLAWNTNVEPKHFGSLLPVWLVSAIDRERKLRFLAGCGVDARAA